MKIKEFINNFDDVNFEEWISQVEKQLGNSFNSLNYKINDHIELNALYNHTDNEIGFDKSNKTILIDNSSIDDYDKVYYFSDLQKDGLDSVNEVAYILYSVLNNYNINENNILIVSSLDIKFYDNIFKFRALRYLLDNLLLKLDYKINYKIVATTSPINKSNLDVENNLLRQSSECVSGVISGVDFISASPYSNYNTDVSQRISDNIMRIIENETYINSIYDATRGAFFFEEGTNEFIKKSFEVLNLLNSMNDDEINSFLKIESQNNFNRKSDNLKSRKDKLLGVNLYINQNDNLVQTSKSSLARYFEEFHLRKSQFINNTNSKPEVYIACFGPYSEIKPRIDFITDFLLTGAFDFKISPIFETIEDAISTIDLINPKYNIILSTNEIYPSILPELITTLRNFNSVRKFGLAGYDKENESRYISLGIDRFYHLKSNIYEDLDYIWQIFENEPNEND